jgi:hypothetical protein
MWPESSWIVTSATTSSGAARGIEQQAADFPSSAGVAGRDRGQKTNAALRVLGVGDELPLIAHLDAETATIKVDVGRPQHLGLAPKGSCR